MKHLIIILFIFMYLPALKADFIDVDGDGFAVEEDCNDNDNTINPAAEELCDGLDNNCDNYIDETGCVSNDIDNDSVEDAEDNCVFIPNINQLDSDSDNIGDVCDNCINVSNEDQKNTDAGLFYISTLIESTQVTYPIPYDIETDLDNNIYICDFMNKQIIKYDSEFNKINEIKLDVISSFIDINSSKNIYILSNYSRKVVTYNSTGEYISEFPIDDNLINIRNIAVTDNNIFVLRITGVDKYTLSGELIKNYPLECDNCVGFDVDKEGNMYISDIEENVVTKVDINGNKVITIGQTGNNDNQFKKPFDIKISNDNYIYILDSVNNNIQIFDSVGVFIEKIQYEATGEEQMYMFLITNNLSKAVISFENTVNIYNLGDNIGDVCDNCINIPNRNQFDSNNNQIGDVCEEIIVNYCSKDYPNGVCEEGKECIEGNCVIINNDNNNSSGSDDGCSYTAVETRQCLVFTNGIMLFIMVIGLYISKKYLKTK